MLGSYSPNYLFRATHSGATVGNVIHRENWPTAPARQIQVAARPVARPATRQAGSWPTAEAWVRRSAWLMVVAVCAIDVAMTFGPHLPLH